MRPLLVFLRYLRAKLDGGTRRQHYHFVRKMNGAIGLLVVAECPQTGHDNILKRGVPVVNQVVDGFGASEMRTTNFWLRMRAGDVNGLPRPVKKILAKQSEFPELVGNVLAYISDGAVDRK